MENNNISPNIHTNSTNSKKDIKKKYRYNDSLGKYKKENPNLVKKRKKVDLSLKNEGADISNISSQINEKNNILNYNQIGRLELCQKYRNKTSTSIPKYHVLKASTPKRDFNFQKRNLHLNSNNINNTTYNKKIDDFNNAFEFETRNTISHFQTPFFTITNRNYSNYSKPNIEYNISKDRSNYILDNAKLKQISNLDNILNKHDTESSQINKEINELRNINKKLYIENNNILMKFKALKKESDITNDALNDLNIKNKKIRELSDEFKKLKLIMPSFAFFSNIIAWIDMIFLKEKENENINYFENIFKNNNNLKENFQEEFEYNVDNSENINNNNELNNIINNLNKQINILKQKNKDLLSEKQKIMQMSNEKINKIIKDNNKEHENIVNKLKMEIKNKNNIISQIQNQNQNSDAEKKIKSLNTLNNELQKKLSEKDNLISALIQEKNELKEQMMQERNNIKSSQSFKESKTSILENNKSLKDELDKKIAEIDALKKKNHKLEDDNNLLNSENINLKEKITSYINTNNNLNQKIIQLQNELNSLSKPQYTNNNYDMEQNDNNSKNNQQIIMLQSENDSLRDKLISYISLEKNNNNKIAKLLEANKLLDAENIELKNDVKKLQENIKNLENEYHNSVLQLKSN